MEKELTTEQAPLTASAAQAEAERPAPRYVPAIDVSEDANQYLIWLDMPGCEARDVEVRFDHGVLAILGKSRPRPNAAGTCLSCEFGVGDYYRTFSLGESINVDRIEASYQDGVLALVLPKVDAAKPKRIEVRSK